MVSPRTNPHTEQKLLATLNEKFNLPDFRPEQLELIKADLEGKDIMAVMPTGGGKTVCFQLPAGRSESSRIIISPLIALIRDQVMQLEKTGITVAYLDSNQDVETNRDNMALIRSGKAQLIYVSPEGFASKKFAALVDGININRIVVDEAHCVSAWGHDFRPSYLRIGEIAKTLGSPPISAFTATAGLEVRNDIIKMLGLKDPYQSIQDPVRDNLSFKFVEGQGFHSNLEALTKNLSKPSRFGDPTIIYVRTIKTLEWLEYYLGIESKLPVTTYHSQLTPYNKQLNQELFMRDERTIMIATSAFGMGINKSNIRYIEQFETPDSIEQVVQQGGRAGRDGNKAQITLYSTPYDILNLLQYLNSANPDYDLVTKIYSSLFNRTHPVSDTLRKGKFNSQKYVEFYKDQFGSVVAARAQSALSILEDLGAIRLVGHDLSIITQEAGSNQLPFLEEHLHAKYESDWKKMLAVQYLYSEWDGKPQDFIRSYFTDFNFQITKKSEEDILSNFREDVDQVIEAVAFKDWSRKSLSDTLSGMYHKDDPYYNKLQNTNSKTVDHFVSWAVKLGYLQTYKIGVREFVTISSEGIKHLDKKGIKLKKPGNYEELRGQMFRHKEVLSDALSGWFNMISPHAKSVGDWLGMGQYFRTQIVDVLDKKVTGTELLKDIYQKDVSAKEGPYLVDLLFRLFPDRMNTFGSEFDLAKAEISMEQAKKELERLVKKAGSQANSEEEGPKVNINKLKLDFNSQEITDIKERFNKSLQETSHEDRLMGEFLRGQYEINGNLFTGLQILTKFHGKTIPAKLKLQRFKEFLNS